LPVSLGATVTAPVAGSEAGTGKHRKGPTGTDVKN
jgi:hypothetical protein